MNCKKEFFSQERLLQLINDVDYSQYHPLLKKYNRKKSSNGSIFISYKTTNKHDIGRLYAEGGLGLQSMKSDIRRILASDIYFDIDLKNSHITISCKMAKDLLLNLPTFEKYRVNRDECLQLISDNVKIAKEITLATLYGANISNILQTHNIVLETNNEGRLFLENIKNEAQTIASVVYSKYDQYHDLCKKNSKVKNSDNKFSLLSHIVQNEENKILIEIDKYFQSNNRYMDVYIFDGGLVRKLNQNEKEFPKTLLSGAEDHIKKLYGYDIELIQKPFETTYKPPVIPYKGNLKNYNKTKLDFEMKHFMLDSLLYRINEDDELKAFKMTDAKTTYMNLKYVEEKLNSDGKMTTTTYDFFNDWLHDSNRREHCKIVFQPDEAHCPSKYYNLFTGFEAEKYACDDDDIDFDIAEEKSKIILKHINNLVGCNEESYQYMLQWLANIIQTPEIKSEISILLRDEPGFIMPAGGTGKNLFFDYFFSQIIGEKYYCCIGNNEDLYKNFNSLTANKLLVVVEEAGGNSNFNNIDFLQSKVTCKKKTVSKKFQDDYQLEDHTRYIMFSNNKNPIPINANNRRFAVFDTNKDVRNDDSYFTILRKEMEKKDVRYAFFYFLKNLPMIFTSPIDFGKNIPKTDAIIEMKMINCALHIKWMLHRLKEGQFPNNLLFNNLYNDYTQFIESSREKSDCTKHRFRILIKGAGNVVTEVEMPMPINKHTNKGSLYSWDLTKLVKWLKVTGYLENDFEYLDNFADIS